MTGTVVRVERLFEHRPDRVWSVIGDFAGLACWMPGVENCTLAGPAAVTAGVSERVVTLQGGGSARERLDAIDEVGRWYRYTVMSARGLSRGSHCEVECRVLPEGEGCRVVWTACLTDAVNPAAVDRERVRDYMATFYHEALMSLARVLDGET